MELPLNYTGNLVKWIEQIILWSDYVTADWLVFWFQSEEAGLPGLSPPLSGSLYLMALRMFRLSSSSSEAALWLCASLSAAIFSCSSSSQWTMPPVCTCTPAVVASTCVYVCICVCRWCQNIGVNERQHEEKILHSTAGYLTVNYSSKMTFNQRHWPLLWGLSSSSSCGEDLDLALSELDKKLRINEDNQKYII